VLRAAVLNGTPYNRPGKRDDAQRQRRAHRAPKPRISSGRETRSPRNRRLAHRALLGAGRLTDDKYDDRPLRYTASFEDMNATAPSGEPVSIAAASGGYCSSIRLLTDRARRPPADRGLLPLGAATAP